MDNISGEINNDKNSKYTKGIIIFSILFMLFSIVVCFVLYWNENRAIEYEFSGDLLVDEGYEYEIRNLDISEGNISITMVMIYDEEPSTYEEHVLLKSETTGECYIIPTEIISVDPNDVDIENAYALCGVYANVSGMFFDTDDNYSFYLLNKCDGKCEIISLDVSTKDADDYAG